MRLTISRALLVVTLLAVTSSCHREVEVHQIVPTPSPTVSQTAVPTQRGAISDYAEVFTGEEEKQLELLIDRLRTTAKADMAVLAVESTNGQSMLDYSLAVARTWRPGGESGRGLLLVLAIKDRQWRLQVSDALIKELPDDVSKKLSEPSVELYSQRKYAAGVTSYIQGILNHLTPARH